MEHLLPVSIESLTLPKLRVKSYLNQYRTFSVVAVNNSDSELKLKKVLISLTVHSQADICR